jgi:hypothetical protein
VGQAGFGYKRNKVGCLSIGNKCNAWTVAGRGKLLHKVPL